MERFPYAKPSMNITKPFGNNETMTVKELKKKLAKFDDNLRVITDFGVQTLDDVKDGDGLPIKDVVLVDAYYFGDETPKREILLTAY